MAEPAPHVVSDNRVKLFFRRHARTLSFFGALIVFSTFIVREGIREHLKNLSDSINFAENIFLIRMDTNEVPVFLAYENSRIGRLQDASMPQSKGMPGPALSDMRDDVDLMVANTARTNASRDNIVRAVEILGTDDEVRSTMDQIKNEVATINSRSDYVHSAAVTANNSGTSDKERIKQIIGKANEVSGECTKLRHDTIDTLGRKIIDSAEARRQEYQHFYEQATWLSYCLYTLGWALALVGRLSGAEDLVPIG